MKTSTMVWSIVIIIIVIAGGWWFISMNGSTAPAPSGATTVNTNPNSTDYNPNGTPGSASGDGTTVAQNLTLGTASSAALGSYLTAYNGMTLYSYSPDKPGVSNCSGQCAVNWPPYTVPSADALHLSAALTGKLSTVARADGTLQVAYNGTPLYYYIKDAKVGDTTGQNVGGVWFVVKP